MYFFNESVALVTDVTADNKFHRSIVHLILRTRLVFHALSDAVDDGADGALSLLSEIKLIIGLDFAVTLSSLDSSSVLCDITSEHSAELKWLM